MIIGAGVAFIIPFIYDRIQRQFKKTRVKKFWSIFRSQTDGIQRAIIVNSPIADLTNILEKMRRIELLVSDIMKQEEFLQYLDRIDLIEEVVTSTTVEQIQKIEAVRKFLDDLISSN